MLDSTSVGAKLGAISALLEELDLHKGPDSRRFQEIFRRRAKIARRRYFKPSKVYPEPSGQDVLVEEFGSGVWLFELMLVSRLYRPLQVPRQHSVCCGSCFWRGIENSM